MVAPAPLTMYFQLTYLLLHYIVDSISAVVNKNRTITFTLFVCTTSNRLTGNTSIGEFTFPLDMFSSLKNNAISSPFWVVKSMYQNVFNQIIRIEDSTGVAPEVFFASLPNGVIYLEGDLVIYDKDNFALEPFEITTWNHELELEIIPENESSEHSLESSISAEPPEHPDRQPNVQESDDDGWKPVSWLSADSWNEKEEDDRPPDITHEHLQEVEEVIILDTSFATLDEEEQNTDPFQELLLALKQGEKVRVPYFIRDPLRMQTRYRTRGMA